MKKEKAVYYVRKVFSFVGAIGLGMFIAATIEYGFCFDTVLGMILAVLLMILPNINNTYEEGIEEI